MNACISNLCKLNGCMFPQACPIAVSQLNECLTERATPVGTQCDPDHPNVFVTTEGSAAPRREDAAGVGHHAPHAKRYDLTVEDGLSCIEPKGNGHYVDFDDYEALRRQYDATAEAYRAALSTAERERDELQRIVDLVNAEGSIVKPSTLNRGRVVVVDGRTGLDASEATALEAIAALFEEEDGGESPGRLYITHRVPSGGET